jgi:hypothetical protein
MKLGSSRGSAGGAAGSAAGSVNPGDDASSKPRAAIFFFTAILLRASGLNRFLADMRFIFVNLRWLES